MPARGLTCTGAAAGVLVTNRAAANVLQDAAWLEAEGAGPLRGVWDTQVAAGVLGLQH
jgi:hypothetical protein